MNDLSPPASKSAPAGAQSIARVAAVLRLLAINNARGMRLMEIAKALQLEQPTAHRVMAALAAEGLAARNPATKCFHVGPTIFEISSSSAPDLDLRDICFPAVENAAASSGDTAYLTLRSGLQGVCVARVEGSYPIRACSVDVGVRRPLGIGAGSLALLMMLGAAEQAIILDHNREAYRDIGSSQDAVKTSLEDARSIGHVVRIVRNEPRILSVGVPIVGATGFVFGGLSISAIEERMTEQRRAELVALLQREAAAIAQRLLTSVFL